MRCLPSLLAIALFCGSALATVPPVASASPAEDTTAVTLEPVWARGGDDDEEILFGVPRDVIVDAEGTVFVLDTQLSQIVAFDRDGALIGVLGRDQASLSGAPGPTGRPNRNHTISSTVQTRKKATE